MYVASTRIRGAQHQCKHDKRRSCKTPDLARELCKEPAAQGRGGDDGYDKGHGIAAEIVEVRGLRQPGRAEAEHRAGVVADGGEAVELEHDPAEHDNDNGVDMAQNRQFFEPFEQEHLLNHQKHRIIQSPEQEGPVRAVPDAGERPDNEDVQQLPRTSAAVAAEGDVDIVAEPGAERHVPAPPELRDAPGNVGVIEVLLELKAYHAAEADGHVRVTGEVEVDLQREGYDAQPGAENGEPAVGDGGVVVPELAEAVCDEHLLRHADHEALDAGGELVNAAGTEVELVRNVLVAHDGARDELREERDKGAEADIVALHVRVAAVDVYRVGHRLEGIERDAYRQGDAQRLDVDKRQEAKRLGDEVVVLEKAEQGQVDDHVDDEDGLGLLLLREPPAAYEQAVDVVYRDGKQHEDDENRLAPAVKNEVCDEEYGIAPSDRGDVIQKQHHGQIYEHEQYAGKDHRRRPSGLSDFIRQRVRRSWRLCQRRSRARRASDSCRRRRFSAFSQSAVVSGYQAPPSTWACLRASSTPCTVATSSEFSHWMRIISWPEALIMGILAMS